MASPPPKSFQSDFAVLVPANRLAKQAFDQIARKMEEDPNWNRVARRYIVVNSQKEHPATNNNNGEQSSRSKHKAVKSPWTGHYRLNFSIRPRSPGTGWCVGGGVFKNEYESPEILLTERKGYYDISTNHALIANNFTTGSLMIYVTPNSSVVVDSEEDVDQCVIWAAKTRITFGDLVYTLLRDTRTSRDEQWQRLKFYQSFYHPREESLPTVLSAMPSTTDYVYKDYVIRDIVGFGGNALVFGGEHKRTGNAVAVKKIRRTIKNHVVASREVTIGKILGSHPCVIELLDVILPDEHRLLPPRLPVGSDELHLVFSPLCVTTAETLCDPNESVDDWRLIVLFWQWLDGIEYCHRKGVMHRDIKPTNLAIVTLQTPRARVIDFGAATNQTTSLNCDCGTANYLAPEIWQYRRKREGEPFDISIDIFAFGLSSYRLFCKKPMTWGQEATAEHIGLMQEELATRRLDGSLAPYGKPEPLMELIQTFIHVSPKARTPARAAPSYPGVLYAPNAGDFTRQAV